MHAFTLLAGALCLVATVLVLALAPLGDSAQAVQECTAQELRAATSRMVHVESAVEALAARRGTVAWPAYAADPEAHAGKRVTIANADLRGGTGRIRTPGLFVLTEDVEFAPNADADFRVLPEQSEYAGPAYVLGFFAALAIEAEDVVLDLGGHSLSQSAEFALEQRFYANVELAGAPFINGQGPASFAAPDGEPGAYRTVRNVIVKNGHLGRSSHHGIHGNGGEGVLLHDLTLKDYEVAAVALNGFRQAALVRVHAQGSRTDIPVVGTYANARFLMPFVDRALAEAGGHQAQRTALVNARAALHGVMRDAHDDIVAHGTISEHGHPAAYALFANRQRVSDGNAYGLLLNKNGVAVGEFSRAPDGTSADIALSQCTVEGTRAHVVEVVALANKQGVTFKGPAGDRLRLVDNSGNVRLFHDDGSYRGNPLADAQLALVDFVSGLAPAKRAAYGTLTLDQPHVLAWRDGTLTLDQLMQQHGYRYLRNGDTMFHVNKGVVGLFVEASANVCGRDVTVAGTMNTGGRGSDEPFPGETGPQYYMGAADGGHPAQGAQVGYMGADTRAVCVSGASNVRLTNLAIGRVNSTYGYSRGLDVFNYASQVQVVNGTVDDVSNLPTDAIMAGGGRFSMGLKVGAAVGVHQASDSDLRTERVRVGVVESGCIGQSMDRATAVAAEHLHRESNKNVYEL